MNGFPLIGRALRSVALRWVLLTLLLLAQQGALTHALSHASGHAHESAVAEHAHTPAHGTGAEACHDEHGDPAAPGQCAFDLVYSEVLGGLHAGHTLHLAAADAIGHAVAATPIRGAAVSVHYDSRGPPAFS
jgi:hypothetical protein